jgi:hypothetical protein
MSEYVLPYSAYQVETALKNALEPDETLNKKGVPADALAVRKYIDNNAIGGAQADWNAAEGEPGHVLNRTHWVEPGKMVAILPDTSTFSDEEDPGFFGLPVISLAAGDTYIVSWNGTEYSCVGVDGTTLGEAGAVALGDVYTASGGMVGTAPTGEPFVIMATPAECMAIAIDGSTKLFISIKKVTETVHKLDGKYLPDGVPYSGIGNGALLSNYTIEDQNGLSGLPRLNLVAGETYTVKINDIGEYTCVAVSTVADGIPVVAIGNVEGFTQIGDTGEPFVLAELAPDYAAAWGANCVIYPVGDTITLPVTFSIYGAIEKVHKLDNKFLDLDWKPKYTETLLVPECTIAHNESLDVGVAVSPKDNQTFVVYCDGIRYVARGFDDMDIRGIGDPTGNTMPFFIATFGTSIALLYPGGGTHTISIYSTSVPRLPNDMMPSDLATLRLYSDGEYIYTSYKNSGEYTHADKIRGEALRDSMLARRIIIEYAGAQFEVLRTEFVKDTDGLTSVIGATVVWKDGDTMTFKTLKAGPM